MCWLVAVMVAALPVAVVVVAAVVVVVKATRCTLDTEAALNEVRTPEHPLERLPAFPPACKWGSSFGPWRPPR